MLRKPGRLLVGCFKHEQKFVSSVSGCGRLGVSPFLLFVIETECMQINMGSTGQKEKGFCLFVCFCWVFFLHKRAWENIYLIVTYALSALVPRVWYSEGSQTYKIYP